MSRKSRSFLQVELIEESNGSISDRFGVQTSAALLVSHDLLSQHFCLHHLLLLKNLV